MSVLEFIKVDAFEDEQNLIKKFEEETDTKLQPMQDARILISLIAYYGSLLKSQINDACNLNIVENSRAPFLDFLGKFKNCPRNTKQKGEDDLLIKLNTTFSYDLTINKGFQVKSNDGLYIFETKNDLIIKAGENQGIVRIESQEATEDVNKYKSGEVNTVISSSFSFIDSVSNINGVNGGSDDETDENYIKRILLAPEGFSVAGPELAYIYFALSAHPSIVDVSVDVPNEDATVDINGIKSILTENQADNELFSTKINYQMGEIEIKLKQQIEAESKIKVKIPHPYEIDLYTLTEDGEAGDTVLKAIENKLQDVRPLCDYVVPKSAIVKDFTISGTVYITKNTDKETVEKQVKEVLNSFLSSIKSKLNKSIVKHTDIIAPVCRIENVYDFVLTAPETNLPPLKNTYYRGSLGNIQFERVNYD